MKINEILKEAKMDPDFDDADEMPADPDKDKIPHLVMQLRKALDVEGNYPVLFRDNSKVKIPLPMIIQFLKLYMKLKPLDREKLQDVASNSKEDFVKSLKMFGEKDYNKNIERFGAFGE
jgi:hypothetical protein